MDKIPTAMSENDLRISDGDSVHTNNPSTSLSLDTEGKRIKTEVNAVEQENEAMECDSSEINKVPMNRPPTSPSLETENQRIEKEVGAIDQEKKAMECDSSEIKKLSLVSGSSNDICITTLEIIDKTVRSIIDKTVRSIATLLTVRSPLVSFL